MVAWRETPTLLLPLLLLPGHGMAGEDAWIQSRCPSAARVLSKVGVCCETHPPSAQRRGSPDEACSREWIVYISSKAGGWVGYVMQASTGAEGDHTCGAKMASFFSLSRFCPSVSLMQVTDSPSMTGGGSAVSTRGPSPS